MVLKKMMEKKKVIMMISILFFFSAFLMIFILSSRKLQNFVSVTHHTEEEDILPYQYLEINPETNEKFSKIIEFREELLDSSYEFLFRKNEESGNHILISRVGSQQYKCTGLCYCENNERRIVSSSSSIGVKKSVMYLLTAVSSLVAMNLAKDYFTEECQNKLSESCPSVSLKSKVDDCFKVLVEHDVHKVTSEDDEVRDSHYICTGNCALRKGLQLNKKKASRMLIECAKIKHKSRVILKQSMSGDSTSPAITRYDGNKVYGGVSQGEAKVIFENEHLNPHCKKMSDVDKLNSDFPGIMRERKLNFGYVCAGKNLWGNKKPNPSVRCSKVPENKKFQAM